MGYRENSVGFNGFARYKGLLKRERERESRFNYHE